MAAWAWSEWLHFTDDSFEHESSIWLQVLSNASVCYVSEVLHDALFICLYCFLVFFKDGPFFSLIL